MLKIGLTGGIGSGKSLVSSFFEKLDICIVDADVLAREVLSPGSAVLDKVIQHFGQDILFDNGEQKGQLNRTKLRSIIFDKPHEKAWLEALMHPAIREQICAQLNMARGPFVILVSPLLLETNQHSLVDKVIVVDVDENAQIARASSRDSVSRAQIKSIIQTQISRSERLQAADEVIDNTGSIDDTLTQCQAIYDKLITGTQT